MVGVSFVGETMERLARNSDMQDHPGITFNERMRQVSNNLSAPACHCDAWNPGTPMS